MGTLTFSKEKLQALLIRLFMDGHKGRVDFYQSIMNRPDIEKVLQGFLQPEKSAKKRIAIKNSVLLTILTKAFQEGKVGYPETRESVIQQLIESIPKRVSDMSAAQQWLFDKWSIEIEKMMISTATTNSDPYHSYVFNYDSSVSSRNKNTWFFNV